MRHFYGGGSFAFEEVRLAVMRGDELELEGDHGLVVGRAKGLGGLVIEKAIFRRRPFPRHSISP